MHEILEINSWVSLTASRPEDLKLYRIYTGFFYKKKLLFINNESVNHFSHFISVKVKKKLRTSQAQFREDGFLIKNNVY